jgi:hypothetical protein
MPDSTEAEKEKTTAGQRRINLIWETTQAKIALFVVVVGVSVNALVIVLSILYIKNVSVNQLALVSICLQFINLTAGIVIGFYFSRTNHQAIGGEGEKPVQKYEGR